MTSNGSQAALSDDRLQELAKRHLMMHFTRHSTFRNEDVPIITRGEGCYLYDSKGKRYFDGLAGLFCTQIGYSFGAELGEAAAAQMAELPFYTNWSYAHPRSIELAAKVAELAPGDLNRAFFVSGGSEANEAIIKLVRQYHHGRAVADRHLPAEDAVRAAATRRAPRLKHQPLPPSSRRERAGVHAVPAGRAARRDRAGGPRLGGRRVHGARAELGWHLHAPRGLLPGRARDL